MKGNFRPSSHKPFQIELTFSTHGMQQMNQHWMLSNNDVFIWKLIAINGFTNDDKESSGWSFGCNDFQFFMKTRELSRLKGAKKLLTIKFLWF